MAEKSGSEISGEPTNIDELIEEMADQSKLLPQSTFSKFRNLASNPQ